MATTIIREARLEDATAIAVIYNAAMGDGAANYETRLHDGDERRAWLARLVEQGYPVMVGTVAESVVGFGALTPFHIVSGYRFTVSGSLYVAKDYRAQGVGRLLGGALLEAARSRAYHTIVAGINSANSASIRLLETFGFTQVGYFKEIGHRDGRWYDDVCLQLILDSQLK